MSAAMTRPFPLSDAQEFDATALPLAEAERTPVFADCLRIWRDGCGGGLPCKSCVDALSFERSSLPWIMIVDVERDGGALRFRYRLTGTRIDMVQNKNLTGTYVDQQEPVVLRSALQAAMTAMVESRAPQFVELKFTNVTGNKRWLRALRLPLTGKDHGQDVDHILVAIQLL